MRDGQADCCGSGPHLQSPRGVSGAADAHLASVTVQIFVDM
jgi:hypothetical protein